tara:strand:+ start:3853 stop:4185 length:333 start_codon:yes stop_codon:yes gene_type:complete
MERSQRTLMSKQYDFSQYTNLPWMKRALDPKTPMTKARESILTRSTEYQGKEILYPLIRMENGALKKYSEEEAFKKAIEKNDFITFNTPAEAINFGQALTNYLSRLRKGQ